MSEDLVVRIAEKWFPGAAYGHVMQSYCKSAIREALLSCVEMCEAEAKQYEANAELCDKGGNTHSGTIDINCAITCRNLARLIREAAREEAERG